MLKHSKQDSLMNIPMVPQRSLKKTGSQIPPLYIPLNHHTATSHYLNRKCKCPSSSLKLPTFLNGFQRVIVYMTVVEERWNVVGLKFSAACCRYYWKADTTLLFPFNSLFSFMAFKANHFPSSILESRVR